MTFHKG